MTTLIAVYNSDGCVGRCDAKCYNAVGDKCDCICQGKNHGVGFEKAFEQTQEEAEYIEKAREKGLGASWALHVETLQVKPQIQMELFDDNFESKKQVA